METPILEEIEEWARTLPDDQRKYVSWLLEALAVESSGAYHGGYANMENALRSAKDYQEENGGDIRPKGGTDESVT